MTPRLPSRVPHGAHPPLWRRHPAALAAAALAPALLLPAGPAPAQAQGATAPPAAASAPRPATVAPRAARPSGAAASAPQQVQITGRQAADPTMDERRQSTASRLVIGREELDRMGDGSVSEVLKRLPGVTMGGPAGRGGGPRMRGMGGGYTQLLVDGQRMPPGFSLDDLPPEQIERIEIMRAPVAEYGTRAIAGTINVVMRNGYKRRENELRLGGGVDGSRPQYGGNWTRNGQRETLTWSAAASLFGGGRSNDSVSRTTGSAPDGTPDLDRTVRSEGHGTRESVFLNGRLQWRLGPGETLELQPSLNVSRGRNSGRASVSQPLGDLATLSYLQASSDGRNESTMARLAGTWNTPTGTGGKLQLRFATMLNQSDSDSTRFETGGLAAGGRTRTSSNHSRDLAIDLNGKFSQLLGDSHSMSAGWELQSNQRTDSGSTETSGSLENSLVQDVDARIRRLALYAQDEWEWTKALSFYVGARWEGILTGSDGTSGANGALRSVRNRSGVFTPLAHMVYRVPDSKDQIRASLTRSYRSPNTNQIVGRIGISGQEPDLAKTNESTSPDRAGNPALKPELAWGLEVGYERYLEAGGVLSANVFYRRIDDLIRNVIALETVDYASAQRYVSRPRNIGQADSAGLELEAKMRAADLWDTELPISLRANTTLMWSRVSGVKGPNNRLEGQPAATLNLGLDWPIRGTPLTVGGNWNLTPGFTIQQIDNQSASQGRRAQLDVYGLWRFSPDFSTRLSVNNADARHFDTGVTTVGSDGRVQTVQNATRSTTQFNLRAEMKF